MYMKTNTRGWAWMETRAGMRDLKLLCCDWNALCKKCIYWHMFEGEGGREGGAYHGGRPSIGEMRERNGDMTLHVRLPPPPIPTKTTPNITRPNHSGTNSGGKVAVLVDLESLSASRLSLAQPASMSLRHTHTHTHTYTHLVGNVVGDEDNLPALGVFWGPQRQHPGHHAHVVQPGGAVDLDLHNTIGMDGHGGEQR